MAISYCAGLPAILLAGLFATASPAEIDTRRMQRDIRIMEGVLSDLYQDAPDPHWSREDFRTRGPAPRRLWRALFGGRSPAGQ